MIPDKKIWNALEQSERNARSGRLKRFLRKPVLYPALLTYSRVIYPRFKKGITVSAKTFFGARMTTMLPSGTDVLLNGIKSHDSEIRLSKFLVLTLKPGDCYIDVGAHYGYYSMLASTLVGNTGKVISIEPTAASFSLLEENTSDKKNITILHAAAGDSDQKLILYEYPGPYAEYNTVVENAYVNQAWAKKIKPRVTKVDTILLDKLIIDQNITPAIIKIDVEGSEKSVLNGMKNFLSDHRPIVVMEYLLSRNHENPHHQAASFLKSLGFHSYSIATDGKLNEADDIEHYMQEHKMDSDNIVFMKKS